MGKIYVLRLGHRIARDKRITTHVCLVARAFGADGCLIAGDFDPHVCRTMDDVCKRWGGSFECRYIDNWRRFIRNWKSRKGSVIIHLTMYGINLPDIIEKIRSLYLEGKDILIIVGAEKVPWEIYEQSDFNVAIGNQPHSEVAALAVFLDWLFQGSELNREFPNAELKIVPQERGKRVVKIGESAKKMRQ